MFRRPRPRAAAIPAGALVLLAAAALGPATARADYRSSVSGTEVTFEGDSAQDVLRFRQAGSHLAHNRWGALDPGYVSQFDFDSTVDGEQRLGAADTTVVARAGGGSDDLAITDAALGDGRGYVVSPGDVLWGSGVTVVFSGYGTFDINGTQGVDTFVVKGTSATTALHGQNGDDDVIVGFPTGSLDDVAGAIQVSGDAGSDSVSIDDSGETDGHTYSLGRHRSMQRTRRAQIVVSDVEERLVRTSRGSDHIELMAEGYQMLVTRLETGAGNDHVDVTDGGGLDGPVDGGPGADALDYGGWTSPVWVNLATGSATAVGPGVTGFENALGGWAGDTLTAAPGGSVLLGSDGADTLGGGDGADALIGGLGGDTITGGRGVDRLDGYHGDDTFDSLDGEVDEQVVCGEGMDSVTADAVDPLDASCERRSGGGGAGAGTGTGAGNVAGRPPVITALSLSRSAFRSRGRRRGTTIRFGLSEDADVRFDVERRVRGRRWAVAGGFSRSAVAGPNSVRFSGRLRGRPARPGRYRLTLVAVDRDGERSAPRRKRFRVLR